MQTVTTIKDTQKNIQEWKKTGLSIGLVPTMGYLHEGHGSLITEAKTQCDKVVVSIFVNPTQFAPNEDLAKYPRDPKRDAALCKSLGVDLIFMPEPEEMYPQGFSTFIEVPDLSSSLCGKVRSGHFRGVCTVVNKLFNIIKADKAFFGQKDAQQLLIIKRMTLDLNLGIEIVPCPIVRETDGLAKSSRNVYLNTNERRAAVVLNRALATGRGLLEQGEKNSQAVIRRITEEIKKEPLGVIEYIEVVDTDKIAETALVNAPVLVALAVRFGKTRLIDNFMFEPR